MNRPDASKPLKILSIGTEKALFEDGWVRRRIVEQLKDMNATILVFSKGKFDAMVADNVRVVSTDSWNKYFYVLDACLAVLRIKKHEKNAVWDAVLTQDPIETALVGVFAARVLSCALAIQDHGYHFHGDYYRKESWLNRLRYLFAKWVIKRADAVRVVSKRTEEALIRLGVDQGKIVRFSLAVRRPGARSPEYGMTSSELRTPYFVLAARFVPIKRIDLAIHAFSLVIPRCPDVKLKIVGRGPLEDLVKQKIAEFNLTDKVEVISWTDKLDGLYQNAVATLITSDREGFGMTAVESLVDGTPVIMTDVGCAGEVVKDGENGYVVPVGDVEGLADRMVRVLEEGATVKEGAGRFVWQTTDVGMGDLMNRAMARKKHAGYNNQN